MAKAYLKTPTTTNRQTSLRDPAIPSKSSYLPKKNQVSVSPSARRKEIVPPSGSTNKRMTYFCE